MALAAFTVVGARRLIGAVANKFKLVMLPSVSLVARWYTAPKYALT